MSDDRPTTPAQSLAAFAATRPNRSRSYLDTLPADVQAAIVDSHLEGISAALVAEWLRLEGYDKATPGMVDRWRRETYKARQNVEHDEPA